ncbi:hypothetical protein THIOSC15_3460006 [uncultured Thiomicrorhabdus sp.]
MSSKGFLEVGELTLQQWMNMITVTKWGEVVFCGDLGGI